MNLKLILVIKAHNATHAREVAEAHGFEVRDVTYQHNLARHRVEAYGSEATAARWLVEDCDVSPIPYGSLLFYNYLD